MRLLAVVFLVLSPAAHAGSLPGDPMVQQLIHGETDPVDRGKKTRIHRARRHIIGGAVAATNPW